MIRSILAAFVVGLLTVSSGLPALAESLDVAGSGGETLSTVPGSQHDQQGFFPGGITGDALSKTVTVSGSGAYSRPLGALYGNKTIDYSALFAGQGTATYGTLSGAFSFDAQTHPQIVNPTNPAFDPVTNEGHASLSGHMQMTFNDSGVVNSLTLPIGSPITLHLTVASQAFSIYIGRPKGLDTNGGINDAYGTGYLQVFDRTSLVTLSPSFGAGTIHTYSFNTTVGSRLDVKDEFDLNVGAFAGQDGNNAPFSPYYPEVMGSINAAHTSKFFVDGPGDVSFAADSGHSYALAPHPPAMAPFQLAATGVTTIPGGTGTFTDLNGHASLDGGNLAFYGTGSAGQLGVYKSVAGGAPDVVANTGTAIPGGTGNFTGFGLGAIPTDPCVNGDAVAFFGAGSGGQQGIYKSVGGGAPVAVANTDTAIPGGVGNFSGFSIGGIPTDPCVNGDVVTFFAVGSSGQQGIYRASSGGSPTKVADLSTAIPGGTGNFTGFNINGIPGDPCVSGDTVAFLGFGSSGQQGVYESVGGAAPIAVANVATAVPSGTGNFTAINAFSLDSADASNLAIVGSGVGVKGVYASVGGGALARVVDTTMQLPGSTSTFADFGAVAIDPGDVAFLAFGSAGEKGIIADVGGTLVDVVDVEDTIGGKLIADLDFGQFGFDETGGTPTVTYRATFSDGSSGIFTASVTSPTLAGDYNEDHVVNAADYTVWRNSLGAPAGTLPNDADGGVIGEAQYATWKVNFGLTAGAGGGSFANIAVPEPMSLPLLLVAAMLWVAIARGAGGRISGASSR